MLEERTWEAEVPVAPQGSADNGRIRLMLTKLQMHVLQEGEGCM